jgi:hypothetical protein
VLVPCLVNIAVASATAQSTGSAALIQKKKGMGRTMYASPVTTQVYLVKDLLLKIHQEQQPPNQVQFSKVFTNNSLILQLNRQNGGKSQ